ncbi:MAG TPA: flagellar basal body rod protein FlgC [Ramlibacter sp.]|nr:flagellar basal body rod protein FlgC [Ramlibacter sp.]
MDYSRMFAISGAGMAAERTRVEVAAANLANANTVAGADGALFQPQRVQTYAVPLAAANGFALQVDRALDQGEAPAVFVPEAVVQGSGAAPRMQYEPGHPLADAAGFVARPGVDTATEMVTIMSAMRSYEANVAAANAARALALKALEIGGGA